MVLAGVCSPLGLSDKHTVPAKTSGCGQHNKALAIQRTCLPSSAVSLDARVSRLACSRAEQQHECEEIVVVCSSTFGMPPMFAVMFWAVCTTALTWQ